MFFSGRTQMLAWSQCLFKPCKVTFSWNGFKISSFNFLNLLLLYVDDAGMCVWRSEDNHGVSSLLPRLLVFKD